ncbi:HET-domain-containing protein [Hypoxylon sp. NC0597]|nr:HET-domain-containing protein [Hypoxylon sp. NC0597]
MICQNCRKSLKAASRILIWDLRESALAGCFICKRVMWCIPSQVTCNTMLSERNIPKLSDSLLNSFQPPRESSRYRPKPNRASDSSGLLIHEDSITFALTRYYRRHGDAEKMIMFQFFYRGYASSPILFVPTRKEGHWFRTYSESHAHCLDVEKELRPFLPDRLIEIVDNGSDTLSWRMVHGSNITTTPTPRHVTLSHCWGKSQPMKLQRQNYSTIQERQPDSDPPKTYRDALRVALSLGVRFIWIDSLCIIQDDEADWRSQSPLMGSIYHNSCCNIAATWGIVLHTTTDQLKEYHVADTLSYLRNITNAQLNTRGWVVQERYLARRQLSFARDQVYWECPDLSASEQFPSGVPGFVLAERFEFGDEIPRVKPELKFSSELRLRQSWSGLVKIYSTCGFTKPWDKVFALAGLASRVQETTKDTYIAGLWKRDIHKQLCWCYEGPREHYQGADSLIPTWSWLKMNGKVGTDPVYYSGDTGTSYVKVIDVSGQANDSSRFYSFATTILTLRGIALRVDIRPENTDNCYHRVKCLDAKLEDLRDGRLLVLIHWDEDPCDPEEERLSDILLLWISGWQSLSRGLVLKRLTNQEAQYKRLGTFEALSKPSLTRMRFDFDDIVARKPGLNSGDSIEKEIDVDDERLKDMVQTVTLV